MNTPAASIAALGQIPYELDHPGWVGYLRGFLAPLGDWRPDEFDADRWLFTGNPDNPRTTSERCRVLACDTIVSSRCLCGICRRALTGSDLDETTFIATHQPPATRQRLTELCDVSRGERRCQRRRASNQTGLCHAHTNQWNRRGRHLGLTGRQWSAQVARPLPGREACLVSDCCDDSKLAVQVCGLHVAAWRRSQHGLADDNRLTLEQWAAQQPPRHLQVHQFSLAELSPTPRWELLYALQQRDAQGQRLDPMAVKGLAKALRGIDALATTPYREVQRRLNKAPNVRAYANMLTRIVQLRFEAFRGIEHTDKDVWDCLALDLQAPRMGRRPNLSSVDFTPLSQQWLRDAAKEWVRTFHPDSTKLKRTMQACTLASQALSRRPGGGHQPHDLRFPDMTAVFEAIKGATQSNGQRYDARYRRGLWAGFHAVIDLGRSTEILADLSGTFSRHSNHSMGHEEANEDEIGKAIPETVISQLDAHLDLLEAGRTYGHIWSIADTTTMFRTAYQVLRDTGRRPGEVVSLRVDCLEADGDHYALVYDNHKKHRLRRRLPIASDTANVIQQWQRHHTNLALPTSSKRWLFPACNESTGPGHLTTIRLSTALRRWVTAIPELHSDLPGPEGTPLPFDRTLIYAYAFRHSYAQRHADAGVAVEVLRELMDHRSTEVTQGYYKVGLNRKRQAIAVMSRYVHERTTATTNAVTTHTEPGRGPGLSTRAAASYELRSVAVPFGNCIEPSNVKAGGKQCPIRFQCAGCGFYRPDPSYLPVIEEHVNALRADRETALAMDVDDFVVRNLADQAAAFAEIAASMRQRLQALPDAERAEVEQASSVLRKMRASRDLSDGHTLLPLTVKSHR